MKTHPNDFPNTRNTSPNIRNTSRNYVEGIYVALISDGGLRSKDDIFISKS